TADITANNLILDAGYLRNAQGNNWNLAGNIHLTSNGGIIWGTNNSAGTTVKANIDGIGPLAIGGDDNQVSGQNNILQGINTYTGPTLLLGGTVTLNGANALPVGANLTLGSATNAAGTAAPFTNGKGGGTRHFNLLRRQFHNGPAKSGALHRRRRHEWNDRRRRHEPRQSASAFHYASRWHSDWPANYPRHFKCIRGRHRLFNQ